MKSNHPHRKSARKWYMRSTLRWVAPIALVFMAGCTNHKPVERMEFITQVEYVYPKIDDTLLKHEYPRDLGKDYLNDPSLSEKDIGDFIDEQSRVILLLNNKLDRISQHEDEIRKSILQLEKDILKEVKSDQPDQESGLRPLNRR